MLQRQTNWWWTRGGKRHRGLHCGGLDWAKNTDEPKLSLFSEAFEVLQHLPDFAQDLFYEMIKWWRALTYITMLRVPDAKKTIRKTCDVVGMVLDSWTAVTETRMLYKLQAMDNNSHPIYHTVIRDRRTFSARLIKPKCSTEHDRRSFQPVAIKLYNSRLEAWWCELSVQYPVPYHVQ